MPDHLHLLSRRHRDHAEQMIESFQEESKRDLREAGRRPVNPPVWGGPGWKVFQNSPEQIARTIESIQGNPTAIGQPEQRWEFVARYRNWVPRRWPRGSSE